MLMNILLNDKCYLYEQRTIPESKSSFFEAPVSPKPSMSTSLSGAFRALNVTSETECLTAWTGYIMVTL